MKNVYRFRNFPVALLGVGALCGTACGNDPTGPSGSTAGSAGVAGSAVAGSAGAGASGAPAVGGAGGSSSGAGGAATGGIGGAGGSGGAALAGSGGQAGAGDSGGGAGGPPSTEPFSFFVTSMASMLELAKAQDAEEDDGFGGDFRYGEVGAGAGLRGADKICTVIAEKGMPGNNKTWRAFLSAMAGEDGQPVHAINRIGEGPWYDRAGRVVAMNKAALQNTRPMGADDAIIDDLPNEYGIPNQQPDLTAEPVDNHDTLTASDADGMLDADDLGDTCNDWTSKEGPIGPPRIGHSWPRSSNQSWISQHNAGGCAPGVNIFAVGGVMDGDYRVGAGGGYGGIYCFALQP